MRASMTDAPATVNAATIVSTAPMRLRRSRQWTIASTPPATAATISHGRYHGT